MKANYKRRMINKGGSTIEEELFTTPPIPVEAIKFRMEQSNMTQTDLARIIGSKSRASEILNYKRKLSLSMIRAINKGMNVPLESLISDYDLH